MTVANGATAVRPPLELIERDLPLEPQNIDAEEAVLGCILLYGEKAIPALIDLGLEPGDFHRSHYGSTYAAAVRLSEQGKAIDKITVCAELRRVNALWPGSTTAEQVRVQLDQLTAKPPDAGNAAAYGEIVQTTAGHRRRHRAALHVLQNPGDESEWEQMLVDAAPIASTNRYAHRRVDLEALMAKPDSEIPWRCDEFVVDGHLTVLVGEGGEGKSMLTLAMSKAVQLGTTEAGIDCKAGKVVIFDAENGEWILRDRLRSAQIPIGELEVYDAEGLDLLRNKADQQWVVKRSHGAALVIFDSLRMMCPGAEENNSDHMAPAVDFFKSLTRKTGAAGLLVHHANKGGGFRGSGAIKDQTDLMFELLRHPLDPNASWRRSLVTRKCRLAPEPPERWLGIKGGINGELYFSEADPFEKDAPARPVRDELAEKIVEVVSEHGPIARAGIAKVLGKSREDPTLKRALRELNADGDLLKVEGHRLIVAPGVSGVPDPADPADPAGSGEGGSPVNARDPVTPPLDGLGEKGTS